MKDDRPSGTARLIVRSLILLSRDPQSAALVSPEAAEMSLRFLEASGENAERFRQRAGQGWFRGLVHIIERLTLPGILRHYALRKLYLEEITRQSLAAGTEQVVILGAGFDTLALRLHRIYAQARFWEIDHPATQQVKRKALTAQGLPGDNLCLIPQDLARESLRNALASSPKYHPEAATLFVAEGLLMYLTPEQAAGIFRAVREYSGTGSRFAFTFMEPQPDGQVNFDRSSRIINLWLRRRGETFQWGLAQDKAASYLQAQGFALREIITPEELRRYLPAGQTALSTVGDLIAVADVISEGIDP